MGSPSVLSPCVSEEDMLMLGLCLLTSVKHGGCSTWLCSLGAENFHFHLNFEGFTILAAAFACVDPMGAKQFVSCIRMAPGRALCWTLKHCRIPPESQLFSLEGLAGCTGSFCWKYWADQAVTVTWH